LHTAVLCRDAEEGSGNFPGTLFAQDYQWVREYNTSIRVDDKGECLLLAVGNCYLLQQFSCRWKCEYNTSISLVNSCIACIIVRH